MANIPIPRETAHFAPGVGALLGLSLILTACGGGGGSAAPPPPPAPPVAMATASVSQGQAPLAVTFDASKSTDPQNSPLTYAWTFSDGTTATGVTLAHTFQNHGSYSASVAVNDGRNTTTSALLSITVTPAPPTVQPPTLSVNVVGVAQTSVLGQISATDRESLTLSYALGTSPTVGAATVNFHTTCPLCESSA